MSKWISEKPKKCDLCNNEFSKKDKHFYDFKTTNDGKWAIGCEKCFKKFGSFLGEGLGQRFNLKTLEEVQ